LFVGVHPLAVGPFPVPGRHNAEILADELGLSPTELRRLHTSGAV
jgi:hypothetical protein